MIYFRFSILVLSLLYTFQTFSKTNSDWFQHPSISPNGESILFSYKGDIYKVSSSGGVATPLTINSAWDGYPVWSTDGKQIAFASDRHGNMDVYLMPASGGKAKRLTFHSSNDIPTDFSVKGKTVLFNSTRMDSVKSSLFPRRNLAELYEVSTSGGTPRMVLTTPASEAQYSPDGKKIAYREEKAAESRLRKHDTSAFARDIWVYDIKTKKHKQLSSFVGGDHNPIWKNNNEIYYLSEKEKSNFNVWKMDLKSGKMSPVTNYKSHPVRSLSMAKNGVLAFNHHGSIYTKKNKSARRLKISFVTDTSKNDYTILSVNDEISEFAISPGGKEVAFIARGEVFVTSKDFSTTKRITNTAEQERGVSFHKDGRTLLYASSRNGKWKLYESSIVKKNEKYFFAATSINEELLYDSDTESFQPLYSPDGKKVAFLSGRDEIQVIERESKEVNVALSKQYNYSYSDGDIQFYWSPDSQWLTSSYAPRGRLFITNIAVFPADGSKEPVDISHSGYQNDSPGWGKNGNVIYWASTRFGMRDHGSWGRQYDVMASFLTQDAYDSFTMSKEEYQLNKELEEDKKKEEEKDKKKTDEASKTDKAVAETDKEDKAEQKDKDAEDKVEPVKIEWDNLDERTVRLTKHSSDLGGTVLTKDASKLYYLARFEKGYDLWVQDFREGTTKLAVKLNAENAQVVLSEDDKTLFIMADGKISKAKVADKISAKAITAKAVMELKPAAERAHMFEHAWRKIQDKFYNPNMHGVDWDFMKSEYAAKLPSINNNRDLGRMMEEMMGELNASHTGTYYIGSVSDGDTTAALGLIFDMSSTKGPLTIMEVLDRSPLQKAKSKIRAGMKLVAIDGSKLDSNSNLASLLNNKAGNRIRLTIAEKDGNTFEEVTKPISLGAESGLLYKRWVKTRRELVEKLSEGRIGYVHIRGMNDASYRTIYSEILGENFDKEAIIVDTRWNGGGWLHNDLAKLLSGKNYMNLKVRGRTYSGEPMDQWYKPSIIVMGEGNYSDAHTFPYTYKALNIGEAVGMPVPGTSTSVWWEVMISDDLVFGVPQVGNLNMKGEFLENKQVEPDYRVKNDPESTADGEDKQLSKAVEVMLAKLKTG